MKISSATASNTRLCLTPTSSLNTHRAKERILGAYSEVVNYLLHNYAKYDIFAETDAALTCYTLSPAMSPTQFTDRYRLDHLVAGRFTMRTYWKLSSSKGFTGPSVTICDHNRVRALGPCTNWIVTQCNCKLDKKNRRTFLERGQESLKLEEQA